MGLKHRIAQLYWNDREFQTDPRGVEATLTPQLIWLITRFRRTLVGLKLWMLSMGYSRSRGFQTDPRGVEARAGRDQRIRRWSAFQTDPRGVEASRERLRSGEPRGFRRTLVGLKRSTGSTRRGWRGRFRRTLVGLKRPQRDDGGLRVVFQTDPRGVEARYRRWVSVTPSPSFRRTLVGLKPLPTIVSIIAVDGFRRTLVGLKQQLRLSRQRLPPSFRRTLVGLKLVELRGDLADDRLFQTDPRGVEAEGNTSILQGMVGVSDGPSWG